ncbi:TPA: hypothetical protein N0F65_001802 [Lagenidium giganteum]|uniref:GOLD domain-containing protein n=1 Tax=Lagenidium giganteum TaxID=4803 RepID=A0AAV2Z3Q6_9STRA|nr:TPA: hypothetical protein N0F65_001802 [Lagenidium giganteum]
MKELVTVEVAPATPASPVVHNDIDALKRGWVAPFLLHLHQMLRRESAKILRWTEDGMAFQILDKEAMTKHILPKYFKNKNFASFQRQLNYFGFRKWSKARAQFPTYSRQHFTRDNYDEMALVKRQSKKSRKRKNTDAAEEQEAKRPAIQPVWVANDKCKPILPRVQVADEPSLKVTVPSYVHSPAHVEDVPVTSSFGNVSPLPEMHSPLMPMAMYPVMHMPSSPLQLIPVISPTRKISQGCKLPSLRELSFSNVLTPAPQPMAKRETMNLRVCTTAALVALGAVMPQVFGCTMIAVGRNATADGSTMLAHTDDAGGGAADLRVVRVPAATHPEGSMRPVYFFQGGYPRLVSNERGPEYQPKDEQKLHEPLGHIPQVERTYAYFDQDYGMMNEVQLSMAESTCGAKTIGWPSNLPYGKNMFGIGELSKVALERCATARCAIQTMGDLAVKHGFYSDTSGTPENPLYMDSAESLAIADRTGEAWIFHVLTGKDNTSAVWAAQRVPDNHVTAVANGFVIREMDLDDKDNFMASDNVVSFAEEMGWWNKEMGDKIDFTYAYGFVDTSPIRPLYVGRRVWRVFDVVAPSLKLDSTLGTFTQYATYPFSVQPDKPVELTTIMDLLRDYYQGTEYDMSKGLAAGPFGSPIRWDGPTKGVLGGWERPISMFRTVYSFVLQARSHLPDAIGGVTWYGQGTPHSSVYVPFACGQNEVPKEYLTGKQSEFNQQSAWWAFDFVNNWSLLRFDVISQDVRAKMNELQDAAIANRKKWEEDALALNDTNEISKFLEEKSNAFASDVISQWWSLAWQLVSKFTDGYIVTGELAGEMKTLGYPEWWLKMSEFSKWPGKTFSPRDDVRQEMILLGTLSADAEPQHIKEIESASHAGVSFAQIIGGICVGFVVGAGVVMYMERSRRAGYRRRAPKPAARRLKQTRIWHWETTAQHIDSSSYSGHYDRACRGGGRSAGGAQAMIVEVGSRTQECFYEYVRTKRTAFLKIGVLDSMDQYDIRLKAYGPFQEAPTEDDVSMDFFDQMITTQRDEVSNDVQHNGFNFESEHRGGWYKFCLDNFHSNYDGKVVEFYTKFDLSNEDDLGHEDELEEYAKKEHIEKVTSSLEHLKELLELIQSEQDYYKSRERRHRRTLESSKSRIMWYTALEIGMLAVMYAFQSWLMHKWFNDRGYLTRQWA